MVVCLAGEQKVNTNISILIGNGFSGTSEGRILKIYMKVSQCGETFRVPTFNMFLLISGSYYIRWGSCSIL